MAYAKKTNNNPSFENKVEIVCEDQNYSWMKRETEFKGKRKVWSETNFSFNGQKWERLWNLMKAGGMGTAQMGFYVGAKIDEDKKTVFLKGPFCADIVRDKHIWLWRAFFNIKGNEEPKIISDGHMIKLPDLGEDSTLSFDVNGAII